MTLPRESELLRIFIVEDDKYHGRPLYEAIVTRAHETGMAGATVLRGIMGFGAHSHMHTAKILRISDDLPVVVEIVDTPEHIEAFLQELDGMIGDGLVTLEKVQVITYHAGEETSSS